MDDSLAKKLAKKILDIDELEVLVCCANTTYVLPKCPNFLNHIQNEVKTQFTIINSIDEIKEEILKVAVYKEALNKDVLEPFIEEFGDKFNHTFSGISWYDFMNYGTHKGRAIEILQKELNISKEETVAFGDNFNDIEMLKDAKYSFAMEEAPPDVKKHAKYTCACVETTLTELYNKYFG